MINILITLKITLKEIKDNRLFLLKKILYF